MKKSTNKDNKNMRNTNQTVNDTNKGETSRHIDIEISANTVHGEPQNAFELINKYGTYNIQPTSDTHHDYPQIAQGLSKKENEKSKKSEFGEKDLK